MNAGAAIDKLRLALKHGDTSAVEAILAKDAVLYLPGRTGLSGPYRGRAAILGLMGKLATLTGGSFTFNTDRVMGDGDLAVLLGQAACERRDGSRSVPAVLAVTLAAGMVTEIRVFHHDQPSLDDLC